MSVLSVHKLSKSFGGLQAINELSFELREATILGLIGPNGAGKSTVFNCISGFESYDSGSVFRGDKELPKADVKAHLQAGIYRTFQNTSLFDDMTVLENIALAISAEKPNSFIASLLGELIPKTRSNESLKAAEKQLERFGLGDIAHKPCSTLGAGQRRVVEVIRAQSVNPAVLLLDEPAAGLNPSESLELKSIISRIRDFDTSVILVEHDLKLVMDLCDEVLVIDQGKRIAFGPPYIIQKDKDVISAYLGRKALEE